MTERSLYSPLIKGALKENWALYRISDAAFTGRKPFDIGGSTNEGLAVGLEVKLVVKLDQWDEFPWKIFEDHQLAWLQAYSKIKALGICAIYEGQSGQMTLYFPKPKQFGIAKRYEIQSVKLNLVNGLWRGWRTP